MPSPVCDNLSFAGEVKMTRKHTTFIARDLPGVVRVSRTWRSADRQAQARPQTVTSVVTNAM